MRQPRRAAQQARDNLIAQLGNNQAPQDSDDGEFVVAEHLLVEDDAASDMYYDDEDTEQEDTDDEDNAMGIPHFQV